MRLGRKSIGLLTMLIALMAAISVFVSPAMAEPEQGLAETQKLTSLGDYDKIIQGGIDTVAIVKDYAALELKTPAANAGENSGIVWIELLQGNAGINVFKNGLVTQLITGLSKYSDQISSIDLTYRGTTQVTSQSDSGLTHLDLTKAKNEDFDKDVIKFASQCVNGLDDVTISGNTPIAALSGMNFTVKLNAANSGSTPQSANYKVEFVPTDVMVDNVVNQERVFINNLLKPNNEEEKPDTDVPGYAVIDYPGSGYQIDDVTYEELKVTINNPAVTFSELDEVMRYSLPNSLNDYYPGIQSFQCIKNTTGPVSADNAAAFFKLGYQLDGTEDSVSASTQMEQAFWAFAQTCMPDCKADGKLGDLNGKSFEFKVNVNGNLVTLNEGFTPNLVFVVSFGDTETETVPDQTPSTSIPAPQPTPKPEPEPPTSGELGGAISGSDSSFEQTVTEATKDYADVTVSAPNAETGDVTVTVDVTDGTVDAAQVGTDVVGNVVKSVVSYLSSATVDAQTASATCPLDDSVSALNLLDHTDAEYDAFVAGCMAAAQPRNFVTQSQSDSPETAGDLVGLATQMAVQTDAGLETEANVTYTIVFTGESDQPMETVAVYRLYNIYDQTHLYTTDKHEVDTLTAVDGWNDEGVFWYAPKTGTGAYTIVRLYNRFNGDHYYVPESDAGQIDRLLALGWEKDSEASWFDSAAVTGDPVYTLFNPNSEVDTHLYTPDAHEVAANVALGWQENATVIYAAGVPEGK